MPRGEKLSDMVTDLRAEVGHSLNIRHGTNMLDVLKHQLRRTQRLLWNAHNWPGMLLTDDVTMVAGQRFYDYPAVLDFERIEKVDNFWGNIWTPVASGIGTEEYTRFDSEQGVASDPVRKWKHIEQRSLNPGEDGNPSDISPLIISHQLEVWPIPASAGRIRLRGRMALAAFQEDDDVCTLDSDLIIQFTAAKLLAKQKSDDSEMVMAEAVQLLARIKAQQSKTHTVDLTGYRDKRKYYGRPGIDFIP